MVSEGYVVVSEGLRCGVRGAVRGVMLWCLRGYVVASEGLCSGVGGVMLWCRGLCCGV